MLHACEHSLLGNVGRGEGLNILLLGGSNTGMSIGWAAHFQRLAEDHVVTNGFLGAVGSSFGLLRLLKMEQENQPAPDLIVFEYLLNDLALTNARALDVRLLADTLTDIADFCARRNIRLLFLCLELRYKKRPSAIGRLARVKGAYVRAAREHSLTPCIFLHDVLGAPADAACYHDEHHLTNEVSERVATYVLSAIQAHLPAIPRASGWRDGAFDYVVATRARFSGACRVQEIHSTVFDGLFLEMARPSVSIWPGRGQVVGLMLRSQVTSGVYRLRACGRALRKNAHSQILTVLPKVILLHYLTKRLLSDDYLEVAMPADESGLMKVAEDRTVVESSSQTPFIEQVLEINGVMFWRRRTVLARSLKMLRLMWRGCGE